MTLLVLMILGAAWATIAVRWGLARHRRGRTGSSVVSFRHQLSTLERATPGHSLRLSTTGPVPVVRTTPPVARTQLRRRRDILLALAGAAGLTLLLAAFIGGVILTALLVLTAGSLGAYVFALVQIRKRTAERAAKVRVLRPRVQTKPNFTLRSTASN